MVAAPPFCIAHGCCQETALTSGEHSRPAGKSRRRGEVFGAETGGSSSGSYSTWRSRTLGAVGCSCHQASSCGFQGACPGTPVPLAPSPPKPGSLLTSQSFGGGGRGWPA